jgi:hexosaminidase
MLMTRILLISCFFILTIITAEAVTPDQIAIIPKPKSVQKNDGILNLKHVFRISENSTNGYDWARFVNETWMHGIDYKCINSSDEKCEITIRKSGKPDKNESYILGINATGIEITARDNAGVLYAIETLKQILVQTWNGKEFNIPYMVIQDEPAFAYRGFMLDASRHFQPVATVRHVLDYMLSMKLNIFHWHLSDDQGWRVQSLKHPELNMTGSFMIDTDKVETNGFYTLEEIRDIIRYASERNIQIIPEVDVPGHSLAILRTFPLLTCPYKPGSNAFCAGNPKSYEIMKDIFGELIDIFKPEYIHIGGDERQKDLWNKCDLCLARMKEVGVTNENDLQNKMLIEISGFIHSKGVKTISWAENLEGGIAEGQIIQSWRLRNEAAIAIKKGHYVINSDNAECYLDYPENAEEAKTKPSWMIILPVQKVYNFNIIPAGLSKDEEKMILGSECPLWTESVTIDKIYPQIKNRLEAHAEKCWTRKELKNYPDFAERMNILRDYFKYQFYSDVADMK